MICPICGIKNTDGKDTESCVQCLSDLQVHKLFRKVKVGIAMEKELSKKRSSLIIFQVLPSVLMLICVFFSIFVGVHFLNFLERMESSRELMSRDCTATSFSQLQQMNTTIKRELDLILDQRRENQALQEKMLELTTQLSKIKTTPLVIVKDRPVSQFRPMLQNPQVRQDQIKRIKSEIQKSHKKTTKN